MASRRDSTASGASPARPSRRHSLIRTGETLITSLALALLAKQFLIQAFRIPSGSMEDTLLIGDFLFVNKVLYGPEIPFTKFRLPALRRPEAGDIIVFKPPHVDKDFIKRCVAVAGDTIHYADNVLYVNGRRVEEPYKHIKDNPGGPPGYHRDYRGVVPPGHIFMMGDNRNNSADSRFWGPLPLNRIKGKALTIYMSVDLPRWRLRLSRIGQVIR
jgi:signal peptidase I